MVEGKQQGLQDCNRDYRGYKIGRGLTIVNFSMLLTCGHACVMDPRMLGLFVLLPLLSKVLHVGDSLVFTAGTASSFIAYMLIAVGTEDWRGPQGNWPPGWVMYLSAALQLNSVATVAIRYAGRFNTKVVNSY